MVNIEMYTQYNGAVVCPELPVKIKKHLLDRQNTLKARPDSLSVDNELTNEENKWLARSYPVLAVSAPVMYISSNSGASGQQAQPGPHAANDTR